MDEVQAKSRFGRWAAALLLGVAYIVLAGFSLRTFVAATVLLAFAAAFLLIQTRFDRPRRSFYLLALASLLLLVVLLDASWQGAWMLAVTTWVGVTILALIWTVHYERTERLV